MKTKNIRRVIIILLIVLAVAAMGGTLYYLGILDIPYFQPVSKVSSSIEFEEDVPNFVAGRVTIKEIGSQGIVFETTEKEEAVFDPDQLHMTIRNYLSENYFEEVEAVIGDIDVGMEAILLSESDVSGSVKTRGGVRKLIVLQGEYDESLEIVDIL